MGYAKEIKYQLCKRIVDEQISVEEASLECGASIATIKKWVHLYKENPDIAFKKKDISGGVEKELQGTQGLINVVREQFLMSEKQMSEEAYKRYVAKVGHELGASDIENNADTILKELLFSLPKECRKLVEIGQGLSKMTPTGIIGVDESIIDTCHFGIGDAEKCGLHLDVVVSKPLIQEYK